ncbi:hypothetical protein ADN01_11340 [Levilinea saccharolytica]|uniref:Uncharacterized protein n=1 Tax=Levilinea saccharolytica TaxID=229921 RepID=A0A0P6Y5T1_9CHLR|nr:hypothetical protein ADN01_11340 [Levilinea saccharolytica]
MAGFHIFKAHHTPGGLQQAVQGQRVGIAHVAGRSPHQQVDIFRVEHAREVNGDDAVGITKEMFGQGFGQQVRLTRGITAQEHDHVGTRVAQIQAAQGDLQAVDEGGAVFFVEQVELIQGGGEVTHALIEGQGHADEALGHFFGICFGDFSLVEGGGVGEALFQQIHSFIGEVAVAQVAVGEIHQPGQHLRIHRQIVVAAEVFRQALHDGQSLGGGQFVDADGLEAAFEGGVGFDEAAVFVVGGGGDAGQVAAGQGGLEDGGQVGGAQHAPRAHDGMDFINEEQNAGVARLLQDFFNALLQLAVHGGTRHQHRGLQGDDAVILEHGGHIPRGDALGQTFNNGGFTDAGWPHEDGVALGAAAEGFDGELNFGFTPQQSRKLAGFGLFGQVAAELVEHGGGEGFEGRLVGLGGAGLQLGGLGGRGLRGSRRGLRIGRELGQAVSGRDQNGGGDVPFGGLVLAVGCSVFQRALIHRLAIQRSTGVALLHLFGDLFAGIKNFQAAHQGLNQGGVAVHEDRQPMMCAQQAVLVFFLFFQGRFLKFLGGGGKRLRLSVGHWASKKLNSDNGDWVGEKRYPFLLCLVSGVCQEL